MPEDDLRAADATLAPRLTRDVLQAAVAAVPDDFLQPLLQGTRGVTLTRRRAAYVAFLWKRLKAPRPFLDGRPLPAERRSAPPELAGEATMKRTMGERAAASRMRTSSTLGLALAGVEESTPSYGTPALKVKGKLMAR